MDNSLDEYFVMDKNIPIPLYYQIKQAVIKAIADGKLKGGDMIMPELDFCKRYNVSRTTVRQAFLQLVSEGHLYRLKGRGTYVTAEKIEAKFLNKLESFNEEIVQKGMTPSTKVLSFKAVEGDPQINKKLEINENERLIYIERLRYANGVPLVYVETYLPYEMFKEILKQDMVNNSLYTLLENIYSKRVSRAVREIEAFVVKKKERALLELNKGSAICSVKTVAYTKEDMPVEYSIARYRGDINKFKVELYR